MLPTRNHNCSSDVAHRDCCAFAMGLARTIQFPQLTEGNVLSMMCSFIATDIISLNFACKEFHFPLFILLCVHSDV